MAAGDVLLDDDGNAILDADGNVQLSDGLGDACCCTGPLPELLTCPELARSGIALRPEHFPGSAYVKYKGLCYQVGASSTGLATTDQAATTVTGCDDPACGPCNQCSTPANLPDSLLITLATIRLCPGCLYGFDGSAGRRYWRSNVGTLSASVSLSYVGDCTWEGCAESPASIDVNLGSSDGVTCVGDPMRAWIFVLVTRTNRSTYLVSARLAAQTVDGCQTVALGRLFYGNITTFSSACNSGASGTNSNSYVTDGACDPWPPATGTDILNGTGVAGFGGRAVLSAG